MKDEEKDLYEIGTKVAIPLTKRGKNIDEDCTSIKGAKNKGQDFLYYRGQDTDFHGIKIHLLSFEENGGGDFFDREEVIDARIRYLERFGSIPRSKSKSRIQNRSGVLLFPFNTKVAFPKTKKGKKIDSLGKDKDGNIICNGIRDASKNEQYFLYYKGIDEEGEHMLWHIKENKYGNYYSIEEIREARAEYLKRRDQRVDTITEEHSTKDSPMIASNYSIQAVNSLFNMEEIQKSIERLSPGIYKDVKIQDHSYITTGRCSGKSWYYEQEKRVLKEYGEELYKMLSKYTHKAKSPWDYDLIQEMEDEAKWYNKSMPGKGLSTFKVRFDEAYFPYQANVHFASTGSGKSMTIHNYIFGYDPCDKTNELNEELLLIY